MTALLEREAALAQLAAALDDVRGGRGRLVVVEAPAGAGKTSLLEATTAQAAGVRVLATTGHELERATPFGAIARLLGPAVDADPALLAGAAAPAAWALEREGADRPEHAEAAFAVLHALWWVTAQLAAGEPLLLVLDDAHWADPSSLRALEMLVRRAGDAPVGVVVALRPSEPGAPAELLDELRAAPGAVRIQVPPLSPAAVAALVRSRDPDAGDDACRACHAATGGNPLYLSELLRAHDAAVTVATVAAAQVPTLGERLLARIAAVDPAAPDLARALAVLGDGARLEDAAAVAGLPPERTGALAFGLRQIAVLATEQPVRFAHPVVLRAIANSTTPGARDALHRRAAEVRAGAGGAADEVAAHLAAVAAAGSAEVATAMAAAADRALARAAPDEAVRWLRRALDEDAPAPARADLLHRLGLTTALLRDPAAIGHLQEAMALAPDTDGRVRVGVYLADLLVQSGLWAAGMELTHELTEAAGSGDGEPAVQLAALRALVTLYDPAYRATFERELPRHRELAAGTSWAARALAATLATGAVVRGDTPAARALLAHAISGPELTADRRAHPWVAQAIAAHVLLDDRDAHLDFTARVVADARAQGSFAGLIAGIGLRGWGHSRAGDLPAAEADLETALAMIEDLGLEMAAANAYHVLVDVMAERPRAAATWRPRIEAMTLHPDFQRTWTGAMLLEPRGRLRLAAGQTDAGIADLEEAVRICDALGFGPTITDVRSALGRALADRDPDRARSLVEGELAAARRTGLPRPEGVALRHLGLLTGEREHLAAAVEVLAPTGARLEHARALAALGAAERRAGDDAAARALLADAVVLARACGAEWLADRALDEHRRAGGRRSALGGEEAALTAAERRIAALVAGGATNAEVAQELYVTLKTVETHLTSVYAKLGISGRGARQALADALRGPA